ncbi:MAG TPA: hypothetical protein VLJ61_01000 [Pyrinomonadaceae bacterium]|nr:hypothetical protein [Pyrinomonadaceae bacterium]
MLSLVPIIALFFLANTSGAEQNYKVERLRDVSSVYVEDLGKSEKAKTLRRELIKGLSDSGRVRVVYTPAEADAVLSVNVRNGSKNVDRMLQTFPGGEFQVGSEVVPYTKIVFRLDSKQSRPLWAVKFDYGIFSDRSDAKTARALADRVNREFIKAVERERKVRH